MRWPGGRSWGPPAGGGAELPRKGAEPARLQWRQRAARWRYRTAGHPVTAPSPPRHRPAASGRTPRHLFISLRIININTMYGTRTSPRVFNPIYFIRLFVSSPSRVGCPSRVCHGRNVARRFCVEILIWGGIWGGTGCGFVPGGQVFHVESDFFLFQRQRWRSVT